MKLTNEEYLNLYYSKYKHLGSGSYAKVYAIDKKTAIKVRKEALKYRLSDIEENGKVYFDSVLDGLIEINVEFDSDNIDRLLNIKIPHKNVIFPKEKVFYKGKFIAYTMDYIEGAKGLDVILDESVHYYYSTLFNEDLIRKIDNLARVELVKRKIYVTDMRIQNILYKNGEVYLIDHEDTKTEVEKEEFTARYNKFLFWAIISPITESPYYSVFIERFLQLDLSELFKKIIVKIYTKDGFLNNDKFSGMELNEYNRKYFLTELFMDDLYKIVQMVSEITKEQKIMKKIK